MVCEKSGVVLLLVLALMSCLILHFCLTVDMSVDVEVLSYLMTD